MKHTIRVIQLESPNGSAYLNVIDNIDGRIQVWGNCYKREVYLIQSKDIFELMCFDSKEYANEFLDAIKSDADLKITKIESLE